MIVLPWPGATAWSAPKPIANSRHSATTGGDPDRSTRFVNEPPITPGRCSFEDSGAAGVAGAPCWTPGWNEKDAWVTRSGLDSSAFGYASKVSLTELDGTEEDPTASPSVPTAVISRHPIRSEYACSVRVTRPVLGADAR
jgi:hypothetical protein